MKTGLKIRATAASVDELSLPESLRNYPVPEGYRLHLGCGTKPARNFTNIDGSFNARAAKYPWLRKFIGALAGLPRATVEAPWRPDILIHDLRKPLPFPDNSASCVYSSHVLEHLYFADAKRLIEECFRVLAAGGVLRLVVPDLETLAKEYLNGIHREGTNSDYQPADRFSERFSAFPAAAPKEFFLLKLLRLFNDFHSHKWMYDRQSLAFHLAAAGFDSIQAHQLFESRIADIKEIEDPNRVNNGEGICIEAVKPKR